MVLEMVGHRDANLVPVAAFYGDPDLRVNFCGKLAADANMQVGGAGGVFCLVWLFNGMRS
jgi:hypothetical protein